MNTRKFTPLATGDTNPTPATPARVAGDTSTTATRIATSVWRLADRGGDTAVTRTGTRFMSRLARRLVLTYTRRDDTIIDFDSDTALRDAAAATTRTYIPLTRRHRIAELDRHIRPASLIVLRWPRPAIPVTPAGTGDLLLACQLIAATAPATLAVVSTIETGDTSTSHNADIADIADIAVLLHAATKARFAHTQRILAIASTGDGDTYTYFPDHTGADTALDMWRGTARPGVRVDTLQLATRRQTHV